MVNSKFRLFLITTAFASALPLSAQSEAPAEKPNIIIILTDDMGYSDIGAFGSEIKTPNIDRLAAEGKQFTQFYNTARCCPSRASLLTGLYSHQAGVGHLTYDTGHIGYGDFLTSDSVTIAEVLKGSGYSTYMSGKWHLAPRSYNPKTDLKYWPRRRGFDRFYGTIAGSGSFYDPYNLCRDETLITPDNDPEYKPENFYYTDAVTDNALRYLGDHEKQSDDKPFFLYLAYTAAHWPLHAPEDAIAEYYGKYDGGYTPVHEARLKKLKELNLIPEVAKASPVVGDWEKVKYKKAEARLMETYAAMVSRMDKGVGRVMEQLRESGELDNTLVMYLHDNGGCDEDWFTEPNKDMKPREPMGPNELQTKGQPTHSRDGKPMRKGKDVMAGPADTYTAYGQNWANISNTPFRLYKHYSHEGGISTPFIAHWPAAIKPTLETQIVRKPAHLIDLMATIVDITKAKYPTERNGVKIQPMEGVSLLPVLTDKGDLNRDKPLFFEHESNRAVRDGKWKIVTEGQDGPWELYDMDVDRGETIDLAKQHPDIVKKMAAQWDAWAVRSRVLPLGGWKDRRVREEAAEATANQLDLKQGDELTVSQSLNLDKKGLHVLAEVTKGPVEGVIVSQGASHNGFSLYAKDGKIHFSTRHNKKKGELEISPIPATPFTIGANLEMDGSASLSVKAGPSIDSTNHPQVVKAKFPGPLVKTPTQGLAAGTDQETPVGNYPENFKFKGKLGLISVRTIAE